MAEPGRPGLVVLICTLTLIFEAGLHQKMGLVGGFLEGPWDHGMVAGFHGERPFLDRELAHVATMMLQAQMLEGLRMQEHSNES